MSLLRLLVDIDRTVSNADWREPLIASDGYDFYHSKSYLDAPVPEIVALVRDLWVQGNEIVGVTARPEKGRKMTTNWLNANNVPMDLLLMRPDNDFRSSPDVKMSLVANLPASQRMSVIVDDREDVCLAFKEAGFVALQVHRKPNHEI